MRERKAYLGFVAEERCEKTQVCFARDSQNGFAKKCAGLTMMTNLRCIVVLDSEKAEGNVLTPCAIAVLTGVSPERRGKEKTKQGFQQLVLMKSCLSTEMNFFPEYCLPKCGCITTNVPAALRRLLI